MDQVSRYIDELTGAGDHLSEVHMCTRFTARILGGLLDYEDDAWVINPHAGEDETGEGIPDVSIYAKHGEECFPWIVCEAKLEDREIRDESRRAALWADKRKYVTADTVFFMWLARRTILICNPLGQVLTGVYLQEEETDAPKEIICTTSDRDVREHLSLIAAEQAESLTFLEDFREGELPFGYLDVNRETIARLTGTLRSVLGALRAYLRRRWALMSREYAHYRKKRTALEEALDQGGDAVPRHVQELRRERLDHEHRQCVQLFEYAFPQFCEQQSYTRWSPEENDLSEREALRDIFTTDAAYVIIGRLLFVRFAEDQRDDSGEPLMARKISNGGLQLWRQLIGSGEPFIGKLIDLAFTQAGSVFRQVFSETPFDTLIDLDDREFDRVLLLVLYKLNAFDFRGIDRDLLGDLYQKLLPRDMRKKLGEFYTDDEVVEYILHRTGFVAAAREGAPTILDPACGSGTFLVRAAHYLIEGARARGIDDREILELVGRCINGLDINDFAVFIARINLLFTCFDLVLNAQRDIAFSVHEANSLLQPGQTSMFVTDDGSSLDLGLTRAEQVRDGDYDFVVGNPPYVRIHRLPESEREGLRQLYDNVAHGMIDIATFFVARTRGWLRPDGIAGMIVPRAITDAEHTSQLRAQFSAGRLRLRDVTPLDWVSRQLFDSDVVPAIILWDVDETTPEEVSVRGPVRDVGELVSREGPATRSLPYSTFVGDGDTPWPLAATDRDYDVAQHLDGFGNLVDWVETGFGMMTGPNAHVHDGPATDRTPLLGGADVYSFWRGWPRRWVDVADVANPTLWRGATWDAEARLFTGGNLPTVAVACPVISITVNAAPFDPRSCCLQDTCTYSFASDHSEAGTYALLGLLNSQLLRYYTFVFLRSG
ncbi:MAG: N-6 DNA methylase, partial [Armatimonadota bacterium]